MHFPVWLPYYPVVRTCLHLLNGIWLFQIRMFLIVHLSSFEGLRLFVGFPFKVSLRFPFGFLRLPLDSF